MKTRKGFVSNSSTTSFMVCFKPESKDLSLKTFEFLLRKNERTTGCNISPNLKIFRDTVKDRKENLLKEQKALLKDQKFLEDKITKFSKFIYDTKLMKKLDEIDTMSNDIESVRYSRTITSRINKEEGYFVNKLSKNFNSMKNHVEKIKENLIKINEQYNLIKDLPDDSVIAGWEEDQNFSSLLKDFVDEFEADGRIVVLEKSTN